MAEQDENVKDEKIQEGKKRSVSERPPLTIEEIQALLQ